MICSQKRLCLYCYAIVVLLFLIISTTQHLHSTTYLESNREGTIVGKENNIAYHKVEKGVIRRLILVGSRPPKCEHKCGGCVPCIPIQVPTTTQFANYQPESWKCYCHASFFNP